MSVTLSAAGPRCYRNVLFVRPMVGLFVFSAAMSLFWVIRTESNAAPMTLFSIIQIPYHRYNHSRSFGVPLSFRNAKYFLFRLIITTNINKYLFFTGWFSPFKFYIVNIHIEFFSTMLRKKILNLSLCKSKFNFHI